MKKLVLSALILMLTNWLIAQDTATIKPASIAFNVGLLDFKKTNHTEGLTTTTVNYGVQYLQGITKKIDFVANLEFASLKYPYYTSLKIPVATNSKGYTTFDLGLNYKFLTDEKKVVPYLTAGLGVGIDRLTYYTAYAPMGGGLQIRANKGAFLFLQATHHAETSSLTKKHNEFSIRYALTLKGKDKKAILLPPAPIQVDNDNDGVVDSLDKCPNQAGTAKYNGCPIPDSDHDGVNDELDKCPTEAGIAANNGCEDVQFLLNEVAKNFKFETGKVSLSKKNLSKLAEVIQALNKYPTIQLAIIGNTDNIGSKKVNGVLSNKRAMVVYAYLVKKGVAPTRLTKQGVADTNPIDTNKTKKGRANNRRTDMNVKY